MKHSYVVALVWGIIGVIILGLFVVLLCMPSPLSDLEIHFPTLNGFLYSDAKKYSVGDAEIADTVKKIDIEWPSGEVEIIPTDDDKVSFSEYCERELTDEEKVRYYLDGDVLKLKFCKSWVTILHSFPYKKLTVKVPKTILLSELDIDTASGSVNISELEIPDIDIDSASGKLTFTDVTSDTIEIDIASGTSTFVNVTADELDIDSASGDVRFEGVTIDSVEIDIASGDIRGDNVDIRSFEMDSASGKINLNYAEGKYPKKVDVDAASGDVTIGVYDIPGFTVDLDRLSGDFESDFPCVKKNKKYVCGDGSSDFSFDTASSDVYIKKIE